MIFGHREQIKNLHHMLKTDRVPQALCFIGPSGVGKSTIALQLISYDTCTAKVSEALEPCGRCSNCMRLSKGSHPDVVCLKAEGNSIKIDAIRDMLREVRFRPLEARRRWILIDDAESLTEQAQNALLKTLEQPPKDTHFILICAVQDRLLPTIRSRCQLHRFGALSDVDCRQVLLKLDIPEQELDSALRLTQGAPGQAGAWQDEALADACRDIQQFLAELPSHRKPEQSVLAALNLSGGLADLKKNKQRALEFFQILLREKALEGQFALAQILHAHDTLMQAEQDFKVNTNAELTFNRALLEIVQTLKSSA